MRLPTVVLLVSAVLGVTACATTSRATPVPGVVIEVINAPVDQGPLSIWVHPIYQSTERERLGDVLPGRQNTFTYDAPGVGRYVLRASPQVEGRVGLVAELSILSDTEHVTWDLRSNSVQIR